MKRSVDETLESTRSTTVLDRVRPTVVVRRRVADPAAGGRAQAPRSPSLPHDDDDDGPPSSVNVARALTSLRTDELRRLETILTDNEEAESATAHEVPPAPLPAVRSVRVGPTIAIAELARRMGVPVEDLVTSLVTRGFFSTTVTTSLSRETARTVAELLGFQVEDTEEVEEASDRRRRAARPTATPAKKTRTKKTKTTAARPAKKTKTKAARPAKKKTRTKAARPAQKTRTTRRSGR